VPLVISDTLLPPAVDNLYAGPSPTPMIMPPTNEPIPMRLVHETSVEEERRRVDSSPRLPRCSRVIRAGRGTRVDPVGIPLDPSTKAVKVDGPLEPIPTFDDPTRCMAAVEEETTLVTTRIMATWSLYPITVTRPFQSTL
jgi:hypothetical protein